MKWLYQYLEMKLMIVIIQISSIIWSNGTIKRKIQTSERTMGVMAIRQLIRPNRKSDFGCGPGPGDCDNYCLIVLIHIVYLLTKLAIMKFDL